MIRCGELCKSCKGTCKEDIRSIEISCPVCEDAGCDKCNNEGTFNPGCPYEYCHDLFRAIEITGFCGEGSWPVAGGIMDQSAWFMRLHKRLAIETQSIEDERIRRNNARK